LLAFSVNYPHFSCFYFFIAPNALGRCDPAFSCRKKDSRTDAAEYAVIRTAGREFYSCLPPETSPEMTDLEETSAQNDVLALFYDNCCIYSAAAFDSIDRPAAPGGEIEVAPDPPLEYLCRPFEGRLAQGKLT
jgi:hypothetical protein